MKKQSPETFGKMKILFTDIETAPNLVYAWGLWRQNIAVNQIVSPSHVLCWAAKWYKEKQVMFASRENGGEREMIKGIWDLLNEADVVVTYNGKSFDVPKLNSEFKKYGFPPPSPYQQVDLYRVIRSTFSLPSNKLEYVVKYFNIGSKVKTTGMELWIGCMNGDKDCWKRMEKYNKGDVKLTESLYKEVLPWIKGHPNHGLFMGVETVCPNCGGTSVQKRGLSVSGTSIYQRYQCMNKSCGKWSRSKNSVTREVFPVENPGSLRG